jgi:hypothetical protein
MTAEAAVNYPYQDMIWIGAGFGFCTYFGASQGTKKYAWYKSAGN